MGFLAKLFGSGEKSKTFVVPVIGDVLDETDETFFVDLSIVDNGKFGVANYMGPGTHLKERLARGDPPRTMEDRVAQAHDIRYALAKSQKDVAAADRKMIAKLKRMKAKGQVG